MRYILIILFFVIAYTMQAQPRISITAGLQRCMSGGLPVENCYITTNSNGDQIYVDSATYATMLGITTGSQFALLAGRSAGQLLNGGNAANEDLTLNGTSHATVTSSYVLLQSLGGSVGIGTVSPVSKFTVRGNSSFYHSSPGGGVAEGGLSIKENHASTGGFPVMEISGSSAIWTTGKGIKFYNHGVTPGINFGTDVIAETSFGVLMGIFGTTAPFGTNDQIRIGKWGSDLGIMMMKYASSPYPDLNISAPNVYFKTKTGAAWADGSAVMYGTTALSILGSGRVVVASQLNIPTKTPSSASDTGTTGDIAWDANYIYICTATNTWKRVAISTW